MAMEIFRVIETKQLDCILSMVIWQWTPLQNTTSTKDHAYTAKTPSRISVSYINFVIVVVSIYKKPGVQVNKIWKCFNLEVNDY